MICNGLIFTASLDCTLKMMDQNQQV